MALLGRDAGRLYLAEPGDPEHPRPADESALRSRLTGEAITLRLTTRAGKLTVEVTVAGQRAPEEGRVWAKPTRSAWIHACIALGGSGAGFLASYFYLAWKVSETVVLLAIFSLKNSAHSAAPVLIFFI